jgi:hypothetical protein
MTVGRCPNVSEPQRLLHPSLWGSMKINVHMVPSIDLEDPRAPNCYFLYPLNTQSVV